MTRATNGRAVSHRPRDERRRLLAYGAIAAALLVAVLLAGCGGGAHKSSATDARNSSSTKVMSAALMYANCMRSHGVPDFPDPNSHGGFQLRPIKVEAGHTSPVQDLIPSSPALHAAERLCGPLGSAGRQVTAVQENQAFQKELRAAACMRANGVPGYPDPKLVDGSIDLEFNGKFNPDSPAFRQAAMRCARPGVALAGTLPPG